jgi:low affinity Fe/Cu permease
MKTEKKYFIALVIVLLASALTYGILYATGYIRGMAVFYIAILYVMHAVVGGLLNLIYFVRTKSKGMNYLLPGAIHIAIGLVLSSDPVFMLINVAVPAINLVTGTFFMQKEQKESIDPAQQ